LRWDIVYKKRHTTFDQKCTRWRKTLHITIIHFRKIKIIVTILPKTLNAKYDRISAFSQRIKVLPTSFTVQETTTLLKIGKWGVDFNNGEGMASSKGVTHDITSDHNYAELILSEDNSL